MTPLHRKLELSDPRHPSNDVKYMGIDLSTLPTGESLKDTIERFLPYWKDTRLNPK